MVDFSNPVELRRVTPSDPTYCARCNFDRHICPGCGEHLPHDIEVCADCQVENCQHPEGARTKYIDKLGPMVDMGFGPVARVEASHTDCLVCGKRVEVNGRPVDA